LCETLLWYILNLKNFGTFKSIEENMKWCFGVNYHVEMNYQQSLCSHYQVMEIQCGCNELFEVSYSALELNSITYIIH